MEKIGYYAVIGLLRALAYLPFGVLYLLSDIICFFVHDVFHYRVKMVRKNLSLAFPDTNQDDIHQLEIKFYRHLCDIMVETVKLLHISDKDMHRRFVVTGMKLPEKAALEGRPVFLLIGHMGNWEWMQESANRVEAPSVHSAIYHPLHSNIFDRVMKTIRLKRCPQATLIPTKKTARALIRIHKENDTFSCVFITDQRPYRHDLKHWMTFLNQDTPYFVGAEEIGRHVNAKLLTARITKPRRGHYRVDLLDIQPPEESIPSKDNYPYMEMFIHLLEQNIKEQPELYLWTHNRWRYQRTPANCQ